MAIGKPLLVNQRRSVERTPLSFNTQPLSSNVPAQKLPMLDYNIGQANAKASFAVTEELGNMVQAGVKAAIYIDKTQKDYKRLNMTEEWQQSNLDYQHQFSLAQSPEEKASIISDYQLSTSQFTENWREIQGKTLASEQYLSNLRYNSNKLHSAMSTTYNQDIHKRTGLMYSRSIDTAVTAMSTDPAANMVTGFSGIQSDIENLVEGGHIEAPDALFKYNALRDKIVGERSAMLGTNYAQSVVDNNLPLPTEADLAKQIEGVMGVKLTDRRQKMVYDKFNANYFKKIASNNAKEKAIEAYGKKETRAAYNAFEGEVVDKLSDNLVPDVEAAYLRKQAKSFEHFWPGSINKIEKLIVEHNNGTATQKYVDHFTIGGGGDSVKMMADVADASQTPDGYYPLDRIRVKLEELAKTTGYEGMNRNTINAIVKYYRLENMKIDTDLGKSAEDMMSGIVDEWKMRGVKEMHKKTLFSDLVHRGFSEGGKGVFHTNWASKLKSDAKYQNAYSAVLDEVAQMQAGQTGPFAPEHMDQNNPEAGVKRRNLLKGYIRGRMKEHFQRAFDMDAKVVKDAKVTETVKKENKIAATLKEAKESKARTDADLKPVPTTTAGTPASPESTPAPQTYSEVVHKEYEAENKKRFEVFEQEIAEGNYWGAVATGVWANLKESLAAHSEQQKLSYANSKYYASNSTRRERLAGVASGKYTEEGEAPPVTESVFSKIMSVAKSAVGEDLDQIGKALALYTSRKLEIGLRAKQPTISEPLQTGYGRHSDTSPNEVSTPAAATSPATMQPSPVHAFLRQTEMAESNVNPREVPDILSAPMTTPPPMTSIQEIAQMVAPVARNISDALDEQVLDRVQPTPSNLLVNPEVNPRETPTRTLINPEKVQRALELSKLAGWPQRGSEELAAIDRQVAQEFPEEELVVGKGFSEPMSNEQRMNELSKTSPVDEESTLMMSDFLAKYYNASTPNQQEEYSARAKERLEAYYTNKLSKSERTNLTQMLAVLNKAKPSFVDDLNYLKMPYSEFLDYMISIYGAETNFGTTKKVSGTGVVGEVQVTRESFGDAVKPQGNFGTQMAKAAGFSIEELRTLALPKNDAKLRKLLLKNNKLNFLAGAAILLSKLQYN